MKRDLIKFDLTRDDLPPRPGFNAYTETPHFAQMHHEDLRVELKGDDYHRFTCVLALACQVMEAANEGMIAGMINPDIDSNGDLQAVTVTVFDKLA